VAYVDSISGCSDAAARDGRSAAAGGSSQLYTVVSTNTLPHVGEGGPRPDGGISLGRDWMIDAQDYHVWLLAGDYIPMSGMHMPISHFMPSPQSSFLVQPPVPGMQTPIIPPIALQVLPPPQSSLE